MSLKLKVCGMRDWDNISALAELNPDFIGFNFYPESKRFAGDKLNAEKIKTLNKELKKVGVFVNADESEVIRQVEKYFLNIVQLHGDESVEYCTRLKNKGIKLIKVFRIDDKFDFDSTEDFLFCDYFLFDSPATDFGGSGNTFDWKKLEEFTYNKPYFLAGGISLENINELKRMDTLFALDINSKFETEPGIKNIELIKKLKKQIQ